MKIYPIEQAFVNALITLDIVEAGVRDARRNIERGKVQYACDSIAMIIKFSNLAAECLDPERNYH
jgi:hypothetical protein